MLDVKVSRSDELKLLDSLSLLTLSHKDRVKLLDAAAKDSIKLSRKNQRMQVDALGKKWKKRKTRNKKKMFTFLARRMGVIQNDGNLVLIGWKRRRSGEIAYMHANGIREKSSRASQIASNPHG